MTNTNTRIGIIGGYGCVGSRVANILIHTTTYDLSIGGRNKTMAKRMAENMGPRVSGQVVDIYDQRSLDAFCGEYDIIINCAGPSALILDRVALAALRQGVHYVDPGGYDPLYRALRDKEEAIKGKGLTFLSSAGMFPGISGVFPMHVLGSMFDQVTSLEYWCAGREKLTFNSAYDLVCSLEDLSGGLDYYENGQVKKASLFASWEKGILPPPIGKIKGFLVLTEELRLVIEKCGIDSARGYVNNIGRWVPLAMFYIKIFKRYQTMAQRKRSANLIVKASEWDMNNKESFFMFHLIVKGKKEGRENHLVVITLFLKDSHRATAASVAIAAKLIAEKEVTRSGSFILPEAVNINQFMLLLEEQGYRPSYLDTDN